MNFENVSANPTLEVAALTHIGNFRSNNEDYVFEKSLAPSDCPDSKKWGHIAIVCDGVGGGVFGEVASQMASNVFVETFCRNLEKNDIPKSTADKHAALNQAAQAAHGSVLAKMTEDPSTNGMASTLSAAWIHGNHVHTIQVGDSRIYLLSKNKLNQITDDQSPVGKLQRKGVLTEEQARTHPLKNIVDQVIGGSHTDLHPDCSTHNFQDGDELLLCSDGLSDSLDNATIEYIFKKSIRKGVNHAASTLLEKALDIAGRDNIAIIIIRKGTSPSWIKRLFLKRS